MITHKKVYDCGQVEYFMDCDICGSNMSESWPMEIIAGKHYCGECAVLNGYIDESKYLKTYLSGLHGIKYVVIKDNKIYEVYRKSDDPYLAKYADYRNTKQYSNWRKSVFDRDNYTCQKCGIKSKNLNAHHIKKFKDFPELRYELSNGVTLCRSCHNETHGKVSRCAG